MLLVGPIFEAPCPPPRGGILCSPGWRVGVVTPARWGGGSSNAACRPAQPTVPQFLAALADLGANPDRVPAYETAPGTAVGAAAPELELLGSAQADVRRQAGATAWRKTKRQGRVVRSLLPHP